uniref:Roadblock/LAMTOR2 domain-containing protein n=1 Tax=Oreochromis niloticus TaxID=8128 RepID=A0A669CF62_ORENI
MVSNVTGRTSRFHLRCFQCIPIRSTLDQSMTVQYAEQLQNLVALARSVIRDTDPQNDVITLRVCSKSNEIIVATGDIIKAQLPT